VKISQSGGRAYGADEDEYQRRLLVRKARFLMAVHT